MCGFVKWLQALNSDAFFHMIVNALVMSVFFLSSRLYSLHSIFRIETNEETNVNLAAKTTHYSTVLPPDAHALGICDARVSKLISTIYWKSIGFKLQISKVDVRDHKNLKPLTILLEFPSDHRTSIGSHSSFPSKREKPYTRFCKSIHRLSSGMESSLWIHISYARRVYCFHFKVNSFYSLI